MGREVIKKAMLEKEHPAEYKMLTNPKLIQLILQELNKAVRGENDSKLYLFIAACNVWVKNSQKRPHTLVNSASSSGKSYLTKKVLNILPEALVLYRSRISATTLSYLKANEPGWTWDGKILHLEDISESVLNGDVLKVFLSEGLSEQEITIKPGVVMNLKVKGQPILFTTTAEKEPQIEQVNRLNQISLDETEAQTIDVNLFTAQGYKTGQKIKYDSTITKALEKLDRVNVLVPYSDRIAFVFPGKSVKARRDFPRFLEMIMCSAALHQFQRNQDDKGNILADKQDYTLALSCLKKMRLSEQMTSLTPTEEEMLDVCKRLTENSPISESEQTGQEIQKGFTSEDAITKYPKVTKRYWFKILKKFLTEGLLTVHLLKKEGVKQKVRFYKFKSEFEGFKLPDYENLINEYRS